MLLDLLVALLEPVLDLLDGDGDPPPPFPK